MAEAPTLPAGVSAPSVKELKLDARGLPEPGVLLGYFMMVFGMFMAVLDIQIVAASINQIQAGLGASPEEASWVQTSYLVAEVVMIPLSGFLSRALSTRWLFVLSSAGFTLASALCATATTLEEMVVYRALQGFIGGAMIPIAFGTTLHLFGRNRQGGMMVFVSMVVTLAPTIGPTLGGWISDTLSWHWLFLVNVIPGILISIGVWALVDVDEPDLSLLRRLDVIGLVAMAAFLASLEYVLEEGARDQWFEDDLIVGLSLLSAVAGLIFFYRAFTAREPIVNLRAFTDGNFVAGTLIGAMMGVGLYGLVYLYPLYLSRIAGLSSEQIGTVLSVSGLAMVLAAPVANLIRAHVDVRVLACMGMSMMALSAYLGVGMTAEWRFNELFLPQVLRGAGLMFCMSSISIVAFATLPMNLVKDASGLFTLCRNLGGAMGLAMINTILQWRTTLHWSRMVEAVHAGRVETDTWLAQAQARLAGLGVPDATAAANRQLGDLVMREALVMSYADCLWVMMVIFCIGAVMPLLMRKAGTASPVGDAH